jgi:hypothetical protein
MKSLDTLLAEAVEKMKSSTRKRFAKKTAGEKMSAELLVNIAESLLDEDGEEVRESRIRRNNGAAGFVSESEAQTAELKESQVAAFLASGFDERTAKAMAGLDEISQAGESLSESQRADYEFSRLIGLSESEALKVAKSNFIRG